VTPPSVPTAPRRLLGEVSSQRWVSTSMLELELRLERPAPALPGQFCMLNLADEAAMAFSRPLSLLAADEDRLRLLYKVVGRGTRLLSRLVPGEMVRVLTPLGTGFPARNDGRPRVLLAGGVGLPPLAFWHREHGRPGDLACFGARDGGDAPWPLLPEPWRVSVDADRDVPAGRRAYHGNVVQLAESLTAGLERATVLACGPVPLLAAAARFAVARGWPCLVSLEERMGCGYGVCRGCVAPAPGESPWVLVCKDGPVLPAGAVDWDRFGLDPAAAAAQAACPRAEKETP